MTPNDTRRKALRQQEPLFCQQAPLLRRMGCTAASEASNDARAAALRDLDLLVWDETSKWLARFAADLPDAPYTVSDLLAETALLGRSLGMEVQLPPLVSALTFVRIMAAGDEAFEKYKPIWVAIVRLQDLDTRSRPLFEKYCQQIEANKLDPSTGQETIYRRGDPAERIVATPEQEHREAHREAQRETLLQEVLQATRGWNCPEALGPYWPQWQALWQHLVGEETLLEQLARKCPRGQNNTTPINIRLVAGVAGLMLRHLRSHRLTSVTDKRMAEFIRESWSSDECRKSIGGADGLTREHVRQIEGWMNINVH